MQSFFKIVLLSTVFTVNSQAEESSTKPNILLICIDDLRPELPSFGKGYIHAPNIEKLAKQGRLFKRHYVQAPTCGASRYGLLTGKYPKGKFGNNDAITKHDHKAEPSFPALLRKNGYQTASIGKISHYPGGHRGENWNDKNQPEIPNAWDSLPDATGIWKHPLGQMHGIADGQPRVKGKCPLLEAKDASYPDDPIVKVFKTEIAKLTKQEKPWLCAVGLLRPHLPFACPKKYLDIYKDKKMPMIPANVKPEKGEYWHGSGEFMQYVMKADPRKDEAFAKEVQRHYAACVSYADHSVGEILKSLEQTGKADNTVIILWGDHGWHLGEKKIWGKHTLYSVALHSPLIVKIPQQNSSGIPTDEIVETVDIYPTICELTGIDKPAHTDGKSLLHMVKNPKAKSDGVALSYWRKGTSTITKDEHVIKDKTSGQVTHQYNLAKDPHETKNLVNKP